MRFQEILSERIQLSRHVDQLRQVLNRVAGRYDHAPADRGVLDVLEAKLEHAIKDIIGTKYYRYDQWVKDITFTIDPNYSLKAGAYASELKIVMPETRFLEMFQEKYNYSNGMIANDDKYQAYLNYIASTIIHEMVHVVQHLLQYAQGRKTTAYKSYAGHTRDFHDEVRQGKYSKLYYSSPQEIEAHAHEAAIYVIKKISSLRELSNIRGLIIDRLRMGIPEFDELDQLVTNRYIKRVYQEIQSEIERLNRKPADIKHQQLTNDIRELGEDALEQYSSMIEMNVREYIKQNPDMDAVDVKTEFDSRLQYYEAREVANLISDIRKLLRNQQVPIRSIRRITPEHVSLFSDYNELVLYEIDRLVMMFEINDDRMDAIRELDTALQKIDRRELTTDFASHTSDLLDDHMYKVMQRVDKLFSN